MKTKKPRAAATKPAPKMIPVAALAHDWRVLSVAVEATGPDAPAPAPVDVGALAGAVDWLRNALERAFPGCSARLVVDFPRGDDPDLYQAEIPVIPKRRSE